MSGPEISATRFARVRELFDAALEIPTGERHAFIARATGDDSTIGEEVKSLLAALDRGAETWESPHASLLAATADDRSTVGARIGAYEIVRLIGYGGMGAVFEGVRADDQFRKRVALKFLRRGLEGDLAIRRFRYERQILANLSHKNIAGLLDGGVTPDGQPFIVMEYVDGEPITVYAARQRLGVRGRVQLLRQVCAAVQHAHQNLVVHRDLKPGNILVTPDGTVKLLDFGIARLLRESEGLEQLPATQGGLHAFTPDYASPEQLRGQTVATPSDLYSLGVVACELLCGHRPFVLDGKLFSEMQDIVCATPPPVPSSLVTPRDVPDFGETSLSRLRRQLHGDLDAIVLQALRKEPQRRYTSAEQLSLDLQRYLAELPVAARRDSVAYRTRKFVARRRVEVVAASLVLLSLVGGIIGTLRQARRAARESAKTQQVNTFLSNMLTAVDPGYSGRDVTVAQVLAQAAKDVDHANLDPDIESEVRHSIGQTYYGLGLYDSAEVQIKKAWILRRAAYGELDQRSAQTFSYLVALAEARASFAEAESLGRINLEQQRRMPRSQRNEAEIATAMDNLARAVEGQGRLDEAMKIKLESIDIRRASKDTTAQQHLPYTLNNVAVSYQYRGEFAKADSLMIEALAVEERLHGRKSVNYGNLLRNLASVRADLNKQSEADSLIRESIAILRATVGEHHTEYLRSVSMLAQLLYQWNDMRGSVVASREVVAEIGKGMHEGEASSAQTLQALGLALDSLGQHVAADSALRRSLAIREKYLPADHWAIASSRAVLGYHLGLMGRNAESEAMLTAAYRALADKRGADAQVTKRVAIRLAELLEKIGRRDEARKWRAKGSA